MPISSIFACDFKTITETGLDDNHIYGCSGIRIVCSARAMEIRSGVKGMPPSWPLPQNAGPNRKPGQWAESPGFHGLPGQADHRQAGESRGTRKPVKLSTYELCFESMNKPLRVFVNGNSDDILSMVVVLCRKNALLIWQGICIAGVTGLKQPLDLPQIIQINLL
jgi:hypothetical protein